MLWNWYTINSCFLANGWHVRTKGAVYTTWTLIYLGGFAGTVIGVFLLSVFLEFLRRAQREYDSYLKNRLGMLCKTMFPHFLNNPSNKSVGAESPVAEAPAVIRMPSARVRPSFP